MKTRIIVCGVIVLSLSMFLASAALAECRPNQVEVTIYNEHSGRITVICVNENAVEHIGGDGDIVIPAICPGFSQEEVEAALNDDPDIVCERLDGNTLPPDEQPCTLAECENNELIFSALLGPDIKVYGGCSFGGLVLTKHNKWVINTLTAYEDFLVSDDEAYACIAILDTFVP